MKYRTKIEIKRMILELANAQELKIKIMNKANLSYNQLKEHLTF
jgi:predicted transcriptional regulator